uniref:Putative secreted protein n=1 Tax=Anopheles marajoara TaxID=58244 RepID=A0A2M4C9P4_9DIPT
MNFLPHVWHWCLKAVPLCLSMCRCSPLRHRNSTSQRVHLKIFPSWTDSTCMVRSRRSLNCLPQRSQAKRLTSEWLCRWFFSLTFVSNVIPQ